MKAKKNIVHYGHLPHMTNDITTYRMFGMDYYDAVLNSEPVQTRQVKAIEDKRHISQKIIEEVRVPYLDVMAKKAF